jgi:PAS domain S-box-containing protein
MENKRTYRFWRTAAECLLASIGLAVLTFVGLYLHVVPSTAVVLYFFLIVLISLWSGFVAAIFVSTLAVFCFDYFFTPPIFKFAMTEWADIVTLSAYTSTTFIITRLMSSVRKRTAELQQTNDLLSAEIAERRSAEEARSKSEERFRIIADSLPEPLADIAPDQTHQFANAAFERWWGLTSEQLKGRSLREVMGEETYATIQPCIEKALLGQSASFEGYLYSEKAGRRYVQIDFVPRRDVGRQAYGFYAVLRDLTGLKEAEEKFRGIVEAAPDAIVLANREGRIIMTNPQVELMFGYAQQELIGQPVEILVPARFHSGHIDHRSDYSKKPVARAMGKGRKLTAVRKDGSEFPIEVILTPVETAHGTVVASIIRDITERNQLLQQTRRATILEERSRMARDVHDTLAQGFTGIVLHLEAAEEGAENLTEEVQNRIRRARDVARENLAEIRRSILALSSALPVHGDLPNSIREFVARYSSGIKTQVIFSVQGAHQPLDPATEENLMRIAQQATDNALQHACATSIRIELAYDGATVQLKIVDDGQGFEIKKTGRGLGLPGMRERAEEIGGKFELVSQPGKGTRVTVTVPRLPTALR